MSLKDRKKRWFSDAVDSLTSAATSVNRIVERGANPVLDDLQGIKTAANQARQAAKELDTLAGMLEVEFEKKL